MQEEIFLSNSIFPLSLPSNNWFWCKSKSKALFAGLLFYTDICTMEITFNTPALLFPAISLLLLAYTNRFLALASLVRKLHDEYEKGKENHIIIQQIKSLRYRLRLVRYMQTLGVFSFLCAVCTMYSIYSQWVLASRYIFAVGLLSLLVSLIVSLIEIGQSTRALELELSDIEEPEKFKFITDLWTSKDRKKDDKE